ncbi:hypothetical protein OEZ86_008074 [Tetradesmus obliquus]|nr:hypothetical protein OEZ86_008074 [Tetradesmus obliquus]
MTGQQPGPVSLVDCWFPVQKAPDSTGGGTTPAGHLQAPGSMQDLARERLGLSRGTALGKALETGERATVEQLRKDAGKGLLAMLPTAEAKAAQQQGKDLEGSSVAAKALKKRKAAAAAAAPKSAAAPAAEAAPAKKRKGGKGGKQPPRKKKQSKESEEEAEAGSSSSGGEEDEFEAAASDGDDDLDATEAAATAAAGGRRRRAGAGVNNKFAEYET